MTTKSDEEIKLEQELKEAKDQRQKLREDRVSQVLGDAEKITGEALTAAVKASFEHFEEHSKNAILLARLYVGLINNNLDTQAKHVKWLASYGFAIGLTYDPLKHTDNRADIKYSKNGYHLLAAERSVVLNRLSSKEPIADIYKELSKKQIGRAHV